MNLKQHPLSSAWPAMQVDEYQSLKDSIEVIGVQNPITLFEGMVIDGWHRYQAAKEVGVNCPSKLLGDVDPVDFVKSQNDTRRHISASQKALAITAIYAWKPAHREKKSVPGTELSKSTAELAVIAGVSESYIEKAKAIQASATPEVKAAVKAGTMSVKKAAETTKKKTTKPAAKPTPVASAPVIASEDVYTELDAAQDQIQDLQAMLAVANLGEVAPEDKDQAKNLIAELQEENRKLRINLKAVTTSRDTLMNELNMVKRQCVSLQAKLKKAA